MMTIFRFVVVFAGVGVVVGGCSDALQSASPFSEKQALCELRPGTPQCTDIRKFSGPSLTTFESVCGSLKSSKQNATGYKEGETCPTADMIGGCQTKNGDGSLQTNWFYKSDKFKTEDDVKKECDSNAPFVGPQ
jgi:hypothetical protein